MQGEDEWVLFSAESDGHIVGNPSGELKAAQRGWQEERTLSLLSNTVLFVIVAIRIPRSMQEWGFQNGFKGVTSFLQRQAQKPEPEGRTF